MSENLELLENHIKECLTMAEDFSIDEETRATAHREAMESIDRQNKIKEGEIEMEKLKSDDKFKSEESKRDLLKFGVQILATVVAVPIVGYFLDKKNIDRLCAWETGGETFTTIAGRTKTASLFRNKK